MEAEFRAVCSRDMWDDLFMEIRRESMLHDYTALEACRPENRALNRYRDVNPYDHSRVRLKAPSDTDYINASLVKVPKANRKYVLAQGPLPSTVGHFWLMAWQQGSKAVLMLNRLVEKGQVKCHQYWPKDDADGARFEMEDVGLSLELVSSVPGDHYTVRTLRLTNMLEGGASQEVLHFHYTTWPDFGVPKCPDSFLEFLTAVRESGSLEEDVGPAIVHCSAGIGRSGTFCLVDSCLVMVEKEGPEAVLVKDVLLEMRNYRMGLIQTPDQLKFSYMAIAEGAIKLGLVPDAGEDSQDSDSLALGGDINDDTFGSFYRRMSSSGAGQQQQQQRRDQRRQQRRRLRASADANTTTNSSSMSSSSSSSSSSPLPPGCVVDEDEDDEDDDQVPPPLPPPRSESLAKTASLVGPQDSLRPEDEHLLDDGAASIVSSRDSAIVPDHASSSSSLSSSQALSSSGREPGAGSSSCCSRTEEGLSGGEDEEPSADKCAVSSAPVHEAPKEHAKLKATASAPPYGVSGAMSLMGQRNFRSSLGSTVSAMAAATTTSSPTKCILNNQKLEERKREMELRRRQKEQKKAAMEDQIAEIKRKARESEEWARREQGLWEKAVPFCVGLAMLTASATYYYYISRS